MELPLPEATVGGMSGLIEILEARGGREDLPRLAHDLTFEVDDLLPLVDAAQLRMRCTGSSTSPSSGVATESSSTSTPARDSSHSNPHKHKTQPGRGSYHCCEFILRRGPTK
jgi:hypothetical protein